MTFSRICVLIVNPSRIVWCTSFIHRDRAIVTCTQFCSVQMLQLRGTPKRRLQECMAGVRTPSGGAADSIHLSHPGRACGNCWLVQRSVRMHKGRRLLELLVLDGRDIVCRCLGHAPPCIWLFMMHGASPVWMGFESTIDLWSGHAGNSDSLLGHCEADHPPPACALMQLNLIGCQHMFMTE